MTHSRTVGAHAPTHAPPMRAPLRTRAPPPHAFMPPPTRKHHDMHPARLPCVHAASAPRTMPPGGAPRRDLKNLVHKLSAESRPLDQREALHTIAMELATEAPHSTANKVAVTDAGAILPLVRLLGDGSAVVQYNACVALSWLAGDLPANAVTIAAAGAIFQLVKLLGPGSPAGVQTKAAGALSTLAEHYDNIAKVATAGAIPPLVKLLQLGDSERAKAAATALNNLAVNSGNTISIAVAIPQLVKLLGHSNTAEAAVSLLYNLAVDADNQITCCLLLLVLSLRWCGCWEIAIGLRRRQ
jgi:hypothetical protein